MAITMASLGGVGILHRFMTVEAQAQMVENIKNENSSYVAGAAIGTDHDALVRSKALIDAGVDVLVLDIAHGHAEHAIDALKELKNSFQIRMSSLGMLLPSGGRRSLRGWS